MKTAIESTQNYDAEIRLAKDFSGNISEYDLIILHQFPSVHFSAPELMDKIMQSDASLFFILGAQTSVNTFNNLHAGINISQGTNKNNELFADAVNDFSLFTIDHEALKYLSVLPPLIAPFGNYQLGANSYTLLYQRIGNVRTNQPLLFFNQSSGHKIAILTGEGIWKWRLKEFSEKNTHLVIDDLILKIVQYLSVKEKRTPFHILYKNNFNENEPLLFDAELYNPAGELVNEPDVKIIISNSSKQTYPFAFSKQGKAYSLNAGYFPVGNYKFKAETKLGDKIYTEGGEFIISPLQLESNETVADHQLLYAMSEKSGGKMFYPIQLGDLAKTIEQREDIKAVSYQQKKLKDIIGLKWIFTLLLLMLSAEWFLRKRSGAY